MNVACFTFPSSSPDQAVWVADSSCRGTFSIALMCLSTTLICIWSSVHRDIPLQRTSTFRSLLRDTPLVLVALFAPELLFYFALNQFLAARNLVRQHSFTLKHGFYATMGGFAFRQSVGKDGCWCSQPLKLTVDGVKFVVQHEPDLIPDLPITSIADRSKSNSLGKALLVVQVAWFCLNCASRLAERIPLSLLEVSTLAHGLFTLSSCAMWWSKPLTIDEPTWISLGDNRAKELLALLQILSNDDDEEQMTIPYGRHAYTTSDLVPKLDEFFDAKGFATFSSYALYRCTDYAVTTCIPLIYGFLHLLALRAQFPTSNERDLWRIAAVVIMSSGAFQAMVEVIKDIYFPGLGVSGSLEQAMDRSKNIVYYRILPFFYLLASGYLLVESIRQLWYLPHDAYVVASWSSYIPHWL
ncbi:hypothetical protein SCHPADRAFT_967020 [Schizopora paradoxa]|uniref:Uncharacterized protein n=1 Tax=Schizopora paradoxa TaxID=27342 RepID=A0A0H2SAZ7_9AGAM|nr:hypothetical protein SCHPADRAFT_967020 [Schizopora paradoxa]